MSDFFLPGKVRNVKQFFFEEASRIRRDFEKILTMQHKQHFAQNAIDFFDQRCQPIRQGNGCEIFFDGKEYFKRGVNLFSFCAIFNQEFIVYLPLEDTSYIFLKENLFFVNEKKIQLMPSTGQQFAFDSTIPYSLLTCWLITNVVDAIVLKNPSVFKKFLYSFENLNNEFFFKTGVDIVSLLNSYKNTIPQINSILV